MLLLIIVLLLVARLYKRDRSRVPHNVSSRYGRSHRAWSWWKVIIITKYILYLSMALWLGFVSLNKWCKSSGDLTLSLSLIACGLYVWPKKNGNKHCDVHVVYCILRYINSCVYKRFLAEEVVRSEYNFQTSSFRV